MTRCISLNLPRLRWAAVPTHTLAATYLICGATALQSQPSCVSAPRALTFASMLSSARALATHDGAARLIADGTGCTVDTTPASRVIAAGPVRARFSLHRPATRLAYLGGLADPRMDGAMWSGRGGNGLISAGVSTDLSRLHLVFAPVVWSTQNRSFAHFPARDSMRSDFASPFYHGARSADSPTRFGLSSLTVLDFGESALWMDAGQLDVGISTSTQRWGPHSRTPLLLGPDAPGIPRFFVRTRNPIPTSFGRFSGSVFAGLLSESRFFDRNPSNDRRRLSAWTIEWSPGDSGLFTFGFANAFMRTVTATAHADRMMVLSAEMHSAGDGSRVWAQLARSNPSQSFNQFLRIPYEGVVYDVGLNHSIRLVGGSLVIGFETANLESPQDVHGVQPHDFLTSASTPQGWTHRGQFLGAATGPGSQSQWLAVDWIAGSWTAGIFGERVRWNEDALLREYLPYFVRHDVTVRTGFRAGARLVGYEAGLEVSTGKRLNYLFQNGAFIAGFPTVDIAIPQLRLTLSPISARRSRQQQR